MSHQKEGESLPLILEKFNACENLLLHVVGVKKLFVSQKVFSPDR